MSLSGDDIASISSFSDFDMLSRAVVFNVLFRAFSNKLLIRYHDNIIL